jgi:hypothetical protein
VACSAVVVTVFGGTYVFGENLCMLSEDCSIGVRPSYSHYGWIFIPPYGEGSVDCGQGANLNIARGRRKCSVTEVLGLGTYA